MAFIGKTQYCTAGSGGNKMKKIKRLNDSQLKGLAQFESLPENVIKALNGNIVLMDAFEKMLEDFPYEYIHYEELTRLLQKKKYKKALRAVLLDDLYITLISYGNLYGIKKKDYKILSWYILDYIVENCDSYTFY